MHSSWHCLWSTAVTETEGKTDAHSYKKGKTGQSHCISIESIQIFTLFSSYLVGIKLAQMREVKFRCENMNKVAVHSLLVNVFSNELTDKVLPRAGPSMQREHQGLLWVLVAHESIHSFQDDARRNVLSEHLIFQVNLETWRVPSRKSTGLVAENAWLKHLSQHLLLVGHHNLASWTVKLLWTTAQKKKIKLK